MHTTLVVANETLGGRELLELATKKAAEHDDLRIIVCVPRSKPKHGAVIYDDVVYDAAQVRIDLARSVLRAQGIESIGEVGDPDPYTATMDAVGEFSPDEIVVSTYPATSSGWLKRDLIERIQDATRLPVEHVVIDVDAEGVPFDVTLVVANRTASTDSLLKAMKARQERDSDSAQIFICVVPQEGGGGAAVAAARGRLGQLLDRARSADLVAAGMIGDPDPYTATVNTLAFFRIDDIIISTLPSTRSGWLRADLIERVKRQSHLPVEHVVAQPQTANA